jgi:hypothetical protein
MKDFRKQRLWPVYGGTALFAALIAAGQGDQPAVLAPLTVTAGPPCGDAEVLPGNSLWLDAAAQAGDLPAQRAQVVRSVPLAYGSRSFAPDLRAP